MVSGVGNWRFSFRINRIHQQENKAYLLGNTEEFRIEVNPARRHVVIGNSDQLVARSIVFACGGPKILLILGGLKKCSRMGAQEICR